MESYDLDFFHVVVIVQLIFNYSMITYVKIFLLMKATIFFYPIYYYDLIPLVFVNSTKYWHLSELFSSFREASMC